MAQHMKKNKSTQVLSKVNVNDKTETKEWFNILIVGVGVEVS
jgi:hypothetical protein